MEALIGDAVAAHSNEIEELVREQLEQGRGKDSEKLEPKYKSGLYARKKNAANSSPGLGTPDLKDKGDYYRSIRVRAYANHLEVDATDYKAKYLTVKYPNAIGLNVLSIRVVQRELVLPYLKTRLRAIINP